MSDAVSGLSSDSAARAEQARRAAEESARAQQTQLAQQAQEPQQTDPALRGTAQAAATNAVVAGAAHDNETRGQPGAELISSGAPNASTPALPASGQNPVAVYDANAPSTDNPSRPAGQAPTSRDVDTALRQTAHAPEAARELARQAGVDPARVAVTGNEWRTIDRRTTEIELQRGEHAQGRGPEPRTWDGRPIPPNADAATVARDDVMGRRFGGQENWERVQRHAAQAPQAQLDAAAPANDPQRNQRARGIEAAFAGAGAARALRPQLTTQRPQSLTPDRVRPADAERIARETGVPAERVNRIANDLHAEMQRPDVPGVQPLGDVTRARLARDHGGNPADWQKVSTTAREYQSNGQVVASQGQATHQPNGNGPTTVDRVPARGDGHPGDVVTKFEVHAYRNPQTGQVVEPKLVPYRQRSDGRHERLGFDPPLEP